MATTVEKALMGLVIIAILVSAGTLAYVMGLAGLPGDVKGLSTETEGLSTDLAELAAAEADLAGAVGDLADAVGEYSERIAAIEATIAAIEARMAATELFPGETELYLKALEEGSLALYTVWDVEDMTLFLRAFSERYPGISTSFWHASSSDIIARVLTEYDGGEHSVDIVGSEAAEPVLWPYGALQEYTTVQLDKLIIQDPKSPCWSISVSVLNYNTEVLAAAGLDPPTNWEDAADPKYSGFDPPLLCLDDPHRGSVTTKALARLWKLWGGTVDNPAPETWVNLIEGLKVNSGGVVHGSTSAEMRLLVAGEYGIHFGGLSHDVVREIGLGSPVNYVKEVDPIMVSSRACAIYSLAPHPNAAKLFAEWMVTVEPQHITAELKRTPNRKGIMSPVSIEALFPESTAPVLQEPPEFLADPSAFIETYIRPIWEAA